MAVTQEEKRYLFGKLRLLWDSMVEDGVKIEVLKENLSHQQRGRKVAQRRLDKLCETVTKLEENMERTERQISTLFDELNKLKSLRR